MKNIAALILAAGASSRLGTPKQLLKFKNKTLIRKIAEETLASGLENVSAVTGYEHEAVKNELDNLGVEVFFNKAWREGIGASLRNGLENALKSSPDIQALLILLCDQPYVDVALLQKMISAYRPGQQMIVAAGYSGTFGVPVLVDRVYFPMLAQLKGDEGGKKVFANYPQHIVEIPFPKGAVDIDEANDLENLNLDMPDPKKASRRSR